MKTNTTRTKQWLKKLLQKVRLRYLAHKDVVRFSRTASFSIFDSDYEQVASRIMYNVHALEKGLARTADFRPGFGRNALSNLNDALVVYRGAGHDLDSFAYGQGVSIFQRYRETHVKNGHDVAFLEDIVAPEFLDVVSDKGVAGTKVVRRADKLQNHDRNFYDLAYGRSSVRQFSGRPIDTSKVMAALKAAEDSISLQSPRLACLLGRRQKPGSSRTGAPTRVWAARDARSIAYHYRFKQHIP